MEPLAHKLRPSSLQTFVGQTHLVGEGGPLREAISRKHLFSFVLWGPPGVGKTTLARIYASALEASLFELSAVSAGKADIRKIVDDSADPRSKLLFLDEIHRFNKAQQDFLLPYVESGALTLIGATTENPSFEVIPALLSRCRVFTLKELTDEDLVEILSRIDIKLSKKATTWIVDRANGDARQALAIVENAQQLYGKVTEETLASSLQDKRLRYDKHAEEHHNTISAFIKSMRASTPDAALYYLARMIASGEDPKFIARRMVIFASEDVGLAQPTALVVANEVFRACETIGLPECRINLAHGAVYLAQAKKDRRVYDGIGEALHDVEQYGNLPIPLIIRNAPTKLMKNEGYGAGYEMYPEESVSFLPNKIKNKKYLKP
ncbi:TPA: AAA family ATPase [Patescibacteria group bacterium]|nr:MAG: ATPase, AAA family [Parcubacteria group bacterium GW2011_GWD2_42_14]HCC04707.1 AAA family ATPase [Patescibacteria group bacterium]